MTGKNFTPIDHLIKNLSSSVSLHKETEPIPIKAVEMQKVVEQELKPEVRPFLQKRAETIELPPDLKKLGLQSTSTGQFTGYQNIKLPVADDKIVSGLHAPITSSLRWLVTLALYILRQAHLGLKVVHGHVIRVLKR